jgi:hypothetical protein
LAKPTIEMFERFLPVMRDHRKGLRPDTVEIILRGADQSDIVDWLTVVVPISNTWKYAVSGEKVALMAGEKLAGKTIDMLPPNRASHLQRIYTQMITSGQATWLECIYRFSNGKEATINTLMVPISGDGDMTAIYILSWPNLSGARWLANILTGQEPSGLKPRAIVGTKEDKIDL